LYWGEETGHKAVRVKFKEHLGVLGAVSNIIQMVSKHFSNVLAWSFFFFPQIVFPSDQIAAKSKRMDLELSRLKPVVGRSLFCAVLTTSFPTALGGGGGMDLNSLSLFNLFPLHE